MSDNRRRYRARRTALTAYSPGQPTGNVARHLSPLAALISGIMANKSTQRPHIATHVPDGTNAREAASNALSGGSGMTRARVRSILSRMPRSCCVIGPYRRWYW
jgi:hypothetical protein